MLQIILYAVLSCLVALLGIGKRGGFLMYLAIALALTPIVGIVAVLIAPDANKENGKIK